MAILTSFWLYDLMFISVFGFIALYIKFSIKFNYWKKRNIPIPSKPTFLFGHFVGLQFTKTIMELTRDMYNTMDKERFFGAYFFGTPVLLVRDLELVKNIMVKDFSSFHDRGTFDIDFVKNPLAGHLFLLNGQEWRNLRVKLTPTFTTGKMRIMFPTLRNVGDELLKVLEKCSEENETDLKEIFSRYTTDVISSCAFGIETNSLHNPNSEFRKHGNIVNRPSFKQIIGNFLFLLSPWISNLLQIRLFPEDTTRFFIGVVRETIQHRTNNNIQRNDFLQLLIQLKNLGYVPDADNSIKSDDTSNQQKFTVEQATAQAFIFFIAGFEPASSTMLFALYELALNPELQLKLQLEIEDVTAKHEGQLTYDAMQDMELLDRVVAETLRRYPVAGLIARTCNTDYTVPGSDIVLLKGQDVWLPIYGFHNDPEIYPNPEKFDPNRFLPDEKAKRNPFAYIPFGEGPRSCIGNRFALMQVKVGLIMVLSQFSIIPSAKTPIPIVFDPKANIMQPKGQLNLKVSKR